MIEGNSVKKSKRQWTDDSQQTVGGGLKKIACDRNVEGNGGQPSLSPREEVGSMSR